MKLKPYPAYKSVDGAWWLSEVPAQWGFFPGKRFFWKKKELNDGMRCENRLALTMSGVIPRSLDDVDGLQASEFETYQLFEQGDLAFKLIDLQNIKTSRVGLVPEEGIMSPAYIRLSPQNARVSTRFAYWYYTDLYNQTIFNQLGGGVRQTLAADELLTVPVPEPTPEEQTAIATFLDRETAKLDTLIAKQEKLIELLQEKRRAVISHAVTKGLDPDAPMKDSGVEWLGEVPEHWEVKRLRFVGEAIIGLTYAPEDVVEDAADGVLVLRSSNVQNGKISFEDNVYVRMGIPEKLRTRAGDILICSRNGSRALIGKNAKIDDNSAGITFGAFMTIFRSGANEFLFYVFNSMIFDFQAGSFMTSTVNQLTVGNLYGFEVPMPRANEQKSIANYLDLETSKIDLLIKKAQRSIELAKEHRTALVSAAVTGKIDVREAA